MATERWAALDDLRGLAVIVMIPVNVAAGFAAIPAWFKHAPAAGLTLADMVLPVFLFSLGLSASFSFKKRLARTGFVRTFLHALYRYALLFAFGTVGILFVDQGARWEVLQMLGATGLFSFFFHFLPPRPRLAAGALLLAAVEALRPVGLGLLMAGWYDTGLAGPWGTFSLSFIVIASSVLGEMLQTASARRRAVTCAAAAGILAGAGLLSLLLAPFSKHLLSLSYVLFTTGVACALLALLVVVNENWKATIPVAGMVGRNPLLLYMLHAVLGAFIVMAVTATASALIAWASILLVLCICVTVAWLLDARKLYLRL